MDPKYEKAINDLKEKAYEIYNDENGIKELVDKYKDTILKSDVSKKFSDEVKTSVDLLMDWKDGNYNNISKESIIGIIVCLLFIIDPFDMLPDGIKTLGKLFVFGYLIKLLKDELDKYKNWNSNEYTQDYRLDDTSNGSGFIELPISTENE